MYESTAMAPEAELNTQACEAAFAPRPLRADARRNRALVLKTTQEAFATEGLSVSLDEIARRAGVGPGTVHRHFPTKESLFEAVLVGHMQHIAEWAHLQADADDPGEAFFRIIRKIVAYTATKKDLSDALKGAGIDVRAASAAASADLRSAMGVLLSRAQQQGAVRDDVTVPEVMVLVSGLCVASSAGVVEGNPDLERVIEV